ncbi:MAG TPA: hypothetical protein VGY99_32295 [Candidatus Binataceae bacterium]|nr:hypothetical protein [Candidatus Binataceae bacterium]
MVDELLVTLTLAFEIASVVGSPHTESESERPSSTIAAIRPKRFGILRAHRENRLSGETIVMDFP